MARVINLINGCQHLKVKNRSRQKYFALILTFTYARHQKDSFGYRLNYICCYLKAKFLSLDMDKWGSDQISNLKFKV